SLAFFDEARQVLSAGEKLEAERLGRLYRRMRSQATPEQRRLHDRRLVVEFAWKNSRLNGCGYSLLETDRLLNDGVTAEGRSLAEARVLVNHQKVMERVMEENERYAVLTAEKLTELHGLLMAGLLVDPAVEGGLRQDSVTVIGGDRVPAVGSVCPVPRLLDHLLAELSRNDCPAERALALALTMGVLRPFRRGNDFMARLAATIALLAGGSCPLSGRSLNLQAHVSAVHMLRGTQDVLALKYQFLEQYRKAVNTGF
ncbi:MAG: Fic family protein, partial [Desulfovibrionaceae bacterium]|nr:Fic family protein [Desulfovibrionaceae bacterium]